MQGQSKPMFISEPDLIDLTGHKRPIIQARWLRSQGIPFLFNGAGALVVTVKSIQDKMALDSNQPDPKEIEASSILGGVAGAWDKVSEQLMADLIGLSARALQARRSRGKIPDDIWCKVDGHVMYSIRRFEQWLEGHWPQQSLPPRAERKVKEKNPSLPRSDGYKLV
jgi:hypothetical protein